MIICTGHNGLQDEKIDPGDRVMSSKPPPRVYVVETNGKPLLAFEAVSGREAAQLLKEGWFRDELLAVRSNTQQVWDGASGLRTRIGNDAEISEFRRCASRVNKDSDGLFLAYLIPIDGTV